MRRSAGARVGGASGFGFGLETGAPGLGPSFVVSRVAAGVARALPGSGLELETVVGAGVGRGVAALGGTGTALGGDGTALGGAGPFEREAVKYAAAPSAASTPSAAPAHVMRRPGRAPLPRGAAGGAAA